MHVLANLMLAASAAIAVHAAEDAKVVTLLMPLAEEPSVVARVIGTEGSLTMYAVNCASAAPFTVCDLPDTGITIAGDATTFQYIRTTEYDGSPVHASLGCSVVGKESVQCEASDSQSGSTIHKTTGYDTVIRITPTVTGTEIGTGQISSVVPASTPAAVATASTTAQTSEASVSGTDANATSATDSGNAAMAQSTGSVHAWVAGGAIMALALAI